MEQDLEEKDVLVEEVIDDALEVLEQEVEEVIEVLEEIINEEIVETEEDLLEEISEETDELTEDEDLEVVEVVEVSVEDLQQQIEELTTANEKLSTLLDDKIEIISKLETDIINTRKIKDKDIHDLKAELDSLFLLKDFKRSTLNELIMTRESYYRSLNSYLEKEDDFFTKKRAINDVEGILMELETILLNNDVVITKSLEDGSIDYDWRYHEPIVNLETDEESLVGKVAKSLGDRYVLEDKVLYKEKIALYKQKNIEEEKGE